MSGNQKENLRWLNKTTSLLLIPLLLLALTPLSASAEEYYYAGWYLNDGGYFQGKGVHANIKPEINTIVSSNQMIAGWVNAGTNTPEWIQSGWYNGTGLSSTTNCGQPSSGYLNAYLEVNTTSAYGGRQCNVISSVSVNAAHNYKVSEDSYNGNGRYIWNGYFDSSYSGQGNVGFYVGVISSKMESWASNGTARSYHYDLNYWNPSTGWKTWPGHSVACAGPDQTHYYVSPVSTNSFRAYTGSGSCS